MGCATSDQGRRWPAAVVPFDVSNAPNKVDVIKQAIAFYEKFTAFQFVKRTTEGDFIAFSETSDKDPAGGDPIVQGTWKTVVSGHRLIPVGQNEGQTEVIDWVPDTGETRVWLFDKANTKDPLPDPPVLQHTWQSIRTGHSLSYLGSDQVLDWVPADSSFRVWKIDRAAKGSDDLLPGNPLASGKFSSINKAHKLVPLGSGVILDWQSANGKFRVFHIDPTLAGGKPFDESKPLFNSTWQTIRDPRKLLSFGNNQVLDWEPSSNEIRIWRLDINETGPDPLPEPVLWEGTWSWLKNTNVLVALDGSHLLVWDPPSGDFSVRFVNLGGSHSDQVGREGGKKEIFANAGAGVGTMLHEIGHSLGLYHEQARPDRNQFVTIHEDAIADGEQGNFDKKSKGDVLLPTSYDYGSVMEYGRTSFSKNGDPTLTAPGAFDKVVGIASMPSERDLRTVNVLADPLPGAPRTKGKWQSIHEGHELIALGADRVLDWVPDTGDFRLWRYDAKAKGSADPLPGNAVTSGTWKSIRTGHQLVTLDDNFVLDWKAETGDFRLWRFDRSATGDKDPLPDPAVTTGTWKTIRGNHHLVNLGGRRVLDWDDDGNFRVWKFDPTQADPLVAPPVTSGKWEHGISSDNEFILLGDGHILDRHDSIYVIGQNDRTAIQDGDPLSGFALAFGEWETINGDHRLIPVGKSQVLDWVPGTGEFRVWNYPGKYGSYQPNPLLGSPLFQGTRSQLTKGHQVLELDSSHLLTWHTSSGKFDVWTIKTGTSGGGDALSSSPVKSGTFDIIKDHQLLNVGGGRLLDFVPTGAAGSDVRVFTFDLSHGKPLLSSPITQHHWHSIGKGHELSSLGGGRVLDWVPETGEFRVWTFDASATGSADPISGPVSSGTWGNIQDGHRLIKIDTGHVIDWIHDAGWYRVYKEDPTAVGNFLPSPTFVEGFWKTIIKGHQMISLTGAKVFEWEESSGNYRVWKFAVIPAMP
jgi:Astacin (Peptidase family M12A)